MKYHSFAITWGYIELSTRRADHNVYHFSYSTMNLEIFGSSDDKYWYYQAALQWYNVTKLTVISKKTF